MNLSTELRKVYELLTDDLATITRSCRDRFGNWDSSDSERMWQDVTAARRTVSRAIQLVEYLHQPCVLLKIPQPFRLRISKLLHSKRWVRKS